MCGFPNEKPINLVVLYNPAMKRKKCLALDYLNTGGIISTCHIRWKIEIYHNDARGPGLGEYHVRNREG